MQSASPLSALPQPLLLLPALREGTRDLHERIESHLDLTTRLASRGDYQAMLERYHGVYMTLEAELLAPECRGYWDALGLDSACRRKTDLLECDLRFFGMTTAQVARLKRCPAAVLPRPASTAELVGCVYVVEGATLGGQMIGRCLEQALGLRPGTSGARFFSGYGSRTGAMWQEFRQAAERFVASADAADPGSSAGIIPQAVRAARQTFHGMDTWLSVNTYPKSTSSEKQEPL